VSLDRETLRRSGASRSGRSDPRVRDRGATTPSSRGRGMEFAEVRSTRPRRGAHDRLERDAAWARRTSRSSSRSGPDLLLWWTCRAAGVPLAVPPEARLRGGAAAVLAFSAVSNHDRGWGGALLRPDRGLRAPGAAATRAADRARPARREPQGRGTDLRGPCARPARACAPQHRAVISDFQPRATRRPWRAARRHDVVALHLRDPRETDVPRPASWLSSTRRRGTGGRRHARSDVRRALRAPAFEASRASSRRRGWTRSRWARESPYERPLSGSSRPGEEAVG